MSQDLMHPLVSSSFGNLCRLVAHYGCEAGYLPRLAFLMLMTLVKQPVIWWVAAKYNRAIRNQPIEPAPIFIIGHWRSGTTHLQNVMSADPQFGRVKLLQAAMPHEFLALSDSMAKRLGEMLPEKRLMDNVPIAADVPWEEELALTSVGRLSFYHVSFFPRRMEQVFDEAVMFCGGNSDLVSEWQKQYVHFLKKIQFTQPGLPLLLKNPANTARVSLLKEMFPGARFIHLHRNPYKVFASSIHLYLKAQQAWGLQSTDRDHVVRHVLDSYPKLMNAFFEQRDELGDGELVDVAFSSLQEDPIGTLRDIYECLGLKGFDAAAPHFREYLESQRDYKKNNLPLEADEKAAVAAQWKDVFDRLGYPV